jgi:hypothetical protein
MPDFEYPDRFVEVKSPWTLAICKGEKPSKNNLCSDVQWRKIQYVNDHFKTVEVVVLSKAEAAKLFAKAQTGVLQFATPA